MSDKKSVLSRKKQNSSTVAVQEVVEEDRYAIGMRKDESRYVWAVCDDELRPHFELHECDWDAGAARRPGRTWVSRCDRMTENTRGGLCDSRAIFLAYGTDIHSGSSNGERRFTTC